MTDHETVVFKTRHRKQTTEQPSEPTWDGKWTKAEVVGPLCRDGVFYGEGCEAGAEVEFACSQDEHGTWRGPEARHFQELLAIGMIAGTEQAAAVATKMRAVATERGAIDMNTGMRARDKDGNTLHDEWYPVTAGEAVEIMARRDPYLARTMNDSPEERLEREERERGDMMAEFRRAVGVVAPLSGSKGGGEAHLTDLSDDDLEAVLAARKARSKGGR